MAYANLLAAVTPEQVAAIRTDDKVRLCPSRVTAVSQLMGMRGWVEEPLRRLLDRALNGGELLSAWLWHPLREPVYQAPESVREISPALVQAWDSFLAERSLPQEDWYCIEIGRAVALFRHAAERGEGVVSILQPPNDPERARQVLIPLQPE